MRLFFKFILGVFFLLVAIGLLMLIPSPQPDDPKPWEISIMPDEQIKVMGIHLGTTRYADVQQMWREAGEVAIFVDDNNAPSAEVFFEAINLGGLSARAVLNLQVNENKLQTMISRATSGKLQPSGARRYDPAFADKEELLTAPVTAITYIPSVRLDAEMIRNRFGEPISIQQESAESAAEVWDYSTSGLTIRLHPDERPILTYTARNF